MQLEPIAINWQFQPAFPAVCCWCGQPATQQADLDARMQSEWFGLVGARRITTKWGRVFQVPYCAGHQAKVTALKGRLATFRNIHSGLLLIMMAAVIITLLATGGGFLQFAPNESPFGRFVMTVVGGLCVGAVLLFPLEPLFRFALALVFPLVLEQGLRADLRAHGKAHKQGFPAYDLLKGSLLYLPGISLTYETEQVGSQLNVGAAQVCFTSAHYAAMFKQQNAALVMMAPRIRHRTA